MLLAGHFGHFESFKSMNSIFRSGVRTMWKTKKERIANFTEKFSSHLCTECEICWAYIHSSLKSSWMLLAEVKEFLRNLNLPPLTKERKIREHPVDARKISSVEIRKTHSKVSWKFSNKSELGSSPLYREGSWKVREKFEICRLHDKL